MPFSFLETILNLTTHGIIHFLDFIAFFLEKIWQSYYLFLHLQPTMPVHGDRAGQLIYWNETEISICKDGLKKAFTNVIILLR